MTEISSFTLPRTSRNAHPTHSARKHRAHHNLEDSEPMQDDHMNQRPRTVDRRVSLTTLDEDVALQILSDLDVDDVISLRKTSKDLTFLSRLRTVWHNALISNILSRNLPVPSLPSPFPSFKSAADLRSLSSNDLEVLARESLAVRDNWTSPAPTRTFCARIKTKVMRVLSVTFLPSPVGSDVAARQQPDHCSHRLGTEWLAGRYFISFGYIADGLYSLQIWDAEAVLDSNSTTSSRERVRRDDEEDPDNVKLVAEWIGSGRAAGVAVCNSAIKGEGVLIGFCSVYQDRQTSAQRTILRIFSFNPDREDASDSGVYSREDSLRTLTNLRLARPVTILALTETRVIFQVKGVDPLDEYLTLVRDWRNGWTRDHDWEVVLKPSKHGVGKAVLTVRVIHDFILIFRESVTDIYFLPLDFNLASASADCCEEVSSYVSITNAHAHSSTSRSSPSPPHANLNPSKVKRATLLPSASYKWTWSINSLAVTERISWRHDYAQELCGLCGGTGKIRKYRSCTCAYRPLSLAIRFDSYFPWPVNLIHHFAMHTSPSSFDPSVVNPLDFALPINGAPNVDSEKAQISPFILPPQNTYTIPSSVRLFGRTALVLGAYGTLIWLDSESDYVPLPLLHQGAADRMARVSDATPGGENEGENEEIIETEGFGFAAGTGERIASIHIPLVNPSTDGVHPTNYSGRETILTTSERALPSLIAARSMEGWSAVAADERAGRIVVGDSEGFVEVWDYY